MGIETVWENRRLMEGAMSRIIFRGFDAPVGKPDEQKRTLTYRGVKYQPTQRKMCGDVKGARKPIYKGIASA